MLNAAVGGASNSAHIYGRAADFTIPAIGSVSDVCHAAMASASASDRTMIMAA
jgi:uncharacterized protein YcbK (DUF882 family)